MPLQNWRQNLAIVGRDREVARSFENLVREAWPIALHLARRDVLTHNEHRACPAVIRTKGGVLTHAPAKLTRVANGKTAAGLLAHPTSRPAPARQAASGYSVGSTATRRCCPVLAKSIASLMERRGNAGKSPPIVLSKVSWPLTKSTAACKSIGV